MLEADDLNLVLRELQKLCGSMCDSDVPCWDEGQVWAWLLPLFWVMERVYMRRNYPMRGPQLSERKHQDLGVAHEQIRAPATWSNSFASQGDAYLGISCWPCARMKTMVWKYLSHFPARYIVDDFSVTWDAGEPQLVAEFVWLHEPLCSQGEGEARLLLVVRAHSVSLLCLSKGSWVDG